MTKYLFTPCGEDSKTFKVSYQAGEDLYPTDLGFIVLSDKISGGSEYRFYPEEGVGFDVETLVGITDFIDDLNPIA